MKLRRKRTEPRLKQQDAKFLLKLKSSLKAKLEQEAESCGITLSELIRRRCEKMDLPRRDDRVERLMLLMLNTIERISRDIRRANPISEEHIRLVEALLGLAVQIEGR